MKEFSIIENIVALGEGFDVKEFAAEAKYRKREFVVTRQIIMTLATRLIKKMTLEEAGMPYGKDHATVNHARKTIDGLCDTDAEFRLRYKDYSRRCKMAIENGRDIRSEVIDKLYSKIPHEIMVRTDDGITITYHVVKIDKSIIAKVK